MDPATVVARLSPDHPRLCELRERYRGHPATAASLWTDAYLRQELSLTQFRGDNAYRWQARDAYVWDSEGSTVNDASLAPTGEINYVLSTYYAKTIDRLGLLGRLTDDTAFGNQTLLVDGELVVSRDLLDSTLEINFLERHLRLSEVDDLTTLDIGAGFGRLAYRLTDAYPNLTAALCTDAVPESTFLCEFYLDFRGVADRAVTVPLDCIEAELKSRRVDVATNVHSFSECRLDVVCWWLDALAGAGVRNLMVVPNTGTDLLTREPDGTMLDFAPELARRGYATVACEPKYGGATSVQRLGAYPAWYYLFELR